MKDDRTEEYNEFLDSKSITHKATGFTVLENEINPIAKPHQNASIRYGLRKGRAAWFHDTGLGKTITQLEAARLVIKETGKPFLLVMPLNVAYETEQNTKDETHIYSQLDVNVSVVRERTEIAPDEKVYITNYENLKKFQGIDFGGVSFDESSIFKGQGKYFQQAKKLAAKLKYVFCASATPAPNSVEEMGRQSEALGILSVEEMKSTFFVNRQDKKKTDLTKVITLYQDTCPDCQGSLTKENKLMVCENCGLEQEKKARSFTELGKDVTKTKSKKTRQGWELRPFAEEKFYKWLASWAMAVRLPSDIGFSDEGYILPNLTITPIFIDTNYVPEGQLVHTGLGGVSDRSKVRKQTLLPKCEMALELIDDDDDQWVIWCGLNTEATMIKKLLGDKAVNVQGSDKLDKKIQGLRDFTTGETQILVTKTKICGHGSNFQNCHKSIFIGLGDSWEAFYQAIKRFHRFGQTEEVEIYAILAEEEREIWDNVVKKGKDAEYAIKKLIQNAKEFQKEELDMKASVKAEYKTDTIKNDKYWIMLGDAVERMKEIESNSVGLSVYSPPFEDLFVYSNSERDLGNSANKEDFYQHYKYIVDEIYRTTMPGRKTVVHVADIHARKNKDGFLGLIPFSDRVVELYNKCGWDYQGRIPIAKNPQATAITNKAHELMFITMKRDAARLMPVQPDYLLVFTKPGTNPEPIRPIDNLEMSQETWIEWAGNTWLNGKGEHLENEELTEQDFNDIAKQLYEQYKTGKVIWHDIKETEVINHKGKHGKRVTENDTKHICPLQLEPVERIIKLYSNPGDKVLDMFLGSGTTVYQAVKFGRYGVGIELKPEYFYDLAIKNIENAERQSNETDLFSMAGIKV